jgi:hypothetical protein
MNKQCDCNIAQNTVGVGGACVTKSRYNCNNGGFPLNMVAPPHLQLLQLESLENNKVGPPSHPDFLAPVKERFSIMGAVYPGRDALCGNVPGAT